MANDDQQLITELHRISESLSEISASLKLLSRETAEARLSKVLTKEEISIYDLIDGERSVRDLETITGASKSTISELCQKWAEMGLVSSTGAQKPYKRNFTISELALLQNSD